MSDALMQKVAVVGAGIYGITVALALAPYCKVDLYEVEDDILRAASGTNQFTLHRGYHYPRSDETILASLRDGPAFEQQYAGAVISDFEHYYCISKERSLTSAARYVAVCKRFGLAYELANPGVVDNDRIALAIRVKEHLLDYERLKEICKERLAASGVNVLLNTSATRDLADRYDRMVVCTYARLNDLLNDRQGLRDYQYEVIEKIAVKLPPIFERKSVVIMDGPFMVVSPYGRTGVFLLGNVVHCIHQTNIGKSPIVSEVIRPVLNKGIIKNPPVTNFRLFIQAAEEFFPGIAEAEYAGSMFTVRTVLPYKDETDERPTVVQVLDDRVITVFAGKLAGCVEAANEVKRVIVDACPLHNSDRG